MNGRDCFCRPGREDLVPPKMEAEKARPLAHLAFRLKLSQREAYFE